MILVTFIIAIGVLMTLILMEAYLLSQRGQKRSMDLRRARLKSDYINNLRSAQPFSIFKPQYETKILQFRPRASNIIKGPWPKE